MSPLTSVAMTVDTRTTDEIQGRMKRMKKQNSTCSYFRQRIVPKPNPLWYR